MLQTSANFLVYFLLEPFDVKTFAGKSLAEKTLYFQIEIDTTSGEFLWKGNEKENSWKWFSCSR